MKPIQEIKFYRVNISDIVPVISGLKVKQAYSFNDGQVRNSFLIFDKGIAYTQMEDLSNKNTAIRWWSTDEPKVESLKSEVPFMFESEDEFNEAAVKMMDELYEPVEGAPAGMNPKLIEALRTTPADQLIRRKV